MAGLSSKEPMQLTSPCVAAALFRLFPQGVLPTHAMLVKSIAANGCSNSADRAASLSWSRPTSSTRPPSVTHCFASALPIVPVAPRIAMLVMGVTSTFRMEAMY